LLLGSSDPVEVSCLKALSATIFMASQLNSKNSFAWSSALARTPPGKDPRNSISAPKISVAETVFNKNSAAVALCHAGI
jgi:hypothetical protein